MTARGGVADDTLRRFPLGSRKLRRYFTARRTRTICCGQHVLPFPASGSPSAKQRFARAPKGELPRLYNKRAPKIGARDEQRVSANSTHALFARWEMSKRKKQGVCGARARRRSRRRFAEVPFGKPQIAAELFRSPRETLAPRTHEIFRAAPARKICKYGIFYAYR